MTKSICVVYFFLMHPSKAMWPRTISGIIVVDSASPSQTGLDFPNDVPVCVIDHHQGGSDWSAVDVNICWETSSTAEIILKYAQQYNPTGLDKDSALQLLAGIITDTGRFNMQTPILSKPPLKLSNHFQ